MRKGNVIKATKKDKLATALSLGNGEVFKKNNNLFFYLSNFKKNRLYENSFFIENTLLQNIEFTKFMLINKPLSFYKEYQSSLLHNEQFEELSKIDSELQGINGNAVNVIYSLLKSNHEVELFREMEGLFNKTKVYFYIDEIRSVIVHDDMSSEDILNLLSIKELNVYIYSIERAFGSEDYFIELYKVSLINEVYRLIKEEAAQRKIEMTSIKKLIKSISPSYSTNQYLSIHDKEDLCVLYQSFSEGLQRNLQHFTLDTRGDEAIRIVNSSQSLLEFLSDKIVSVDLLLQSFRNLTRYKKDLKDDEAVRFDYITHRQYKKFTNYKLLVKNFNSRYKEFHKWVKEWYSIVKESEGVKPKLSPNENSIYYQIAKEVAERLSTLWFISEVRLFGSVAKGQEKEGSDIDIAFKVGIEIKDLTIARRETMYRVVKYEVKQIENKYEELVKQCLDKKYGKDKGNILRFIATDKLIDLLAIQFQKKKHQKQYEELDFFQDSVVLFQRESIQLEDGRTFNYQDIEHVLFPTDSLYSFIINKKEENDDSIIYEYIKFDYKDDKNNEDNYMIDYIAYQTIDKNEGYYERRPEMKLAKEFKDKNIFNDEWDWDWEIREEYHIIGDGLQGGIVRINPNVPYIYTYHKSNIHRN